MPGLRASLAVATTLASAGALATAHAWARHQRIMADVVQRLADRTHDRLGDMGAVERLSVVPLVDRAVARPELRGEPGVSYLVRADGHEVLFDTGLNMWGRRRSPLLDNAEALGVDIERIPAVVLSHAHEDHVGGAAAVRAGTFRYAGDPLVPRGTLAFTPVPMRHEAAEVRVTTRTTVLAPGVALLPPLPAAIFWDGAPVLEQALVVNVRDAGLVLVAGCGHPGVRAMADLAEHVLEHPLYGVVGGLHLPVHPWPRHLPQALTGSPRPPWQPLGDPDIDLAIDRLRSAGARLVAVSGHDSTPHTMRRFAAAFGTGFREVRVGEEIVVSAGRDGDC